MAQNGTSKVIIAHLSNKLRSINGNTQQAKKSFLETIYYSCKSVGISNIPDKNELSILWEFVNNQFKDFAIEEIKLAFDYYNAGKLCEPNYQHYNTFSSNYLGAILREYRKFRSKEVAKYQREKEQMNKPKEPTQEEKINARKEYVDHYVRPKLERFKKTGAYTIDKFNGFTLLDALSRFKLITWSEYNIDNYKVLALEEIQKEIESKKGDFGNRFEVRKLVKKLDLYIHTGKDEEIKSNIRLITANIILKDWLKENDFSEFIHLLLTEHS